MQELSQQELLDRISRIQEGAFAVFLYTPFCGTCKVAQRMLDVIITMLPSLPIVKSNINFLPITTREWQITSVPCIVILEHGKEITYMYRMQSVDELYHRLLPLAKV